MRSSKTLFQLAAPEAYLKLKADIGINHTIQAAIEADLASSGSQATNLDICQIGFFISNRDRKAIIEQFIEQENGANFIKRAVLGAKDDLASILINKAFIDDVNGDFLRHIISHNLLKTATKVMGLLAKSDNQDLAKKFIFHNHCILMKHVLIERYNLDSAEIVEQLFGLAKLHNFTTELIDEMPRIFTEIVKNGLFKSFEVIMKNADDIQKTLLIEYVNGCISYSDLAFNNLKISVAMIETAQKIGLGVEKYDKLKKCHEEILQSRKRKAPETSPQSPEAYGAVKKQKTK